MRHTCASGIAALALAACGGEGGSPQVEDRLPPEIARLAPGPCGVLEPGGSVRVTFKEAMDPASKAALTIDGVEGAQDYEAQNAAVVFRPSIALTPGRIYTARLSTQARDEAGNALLEARSWTFRALGAGERAVRLTLSGVGIPLRLAPGADPLAGMTGVRVWIQQNGVDAARRDFGLEEPWDVDAFLSATVAVRVEIKNGATVQAMARSAPFRIPPDEAVCPVAYTALTGQFTATLGPMATPRGLHAAARLLDGRVLLAGGLDASSDPRPLASTELYDPRTGTFSPGPAMSVARYELSAATLADGRVILAGGRGQGGEATDLVEVYDPVLGTIAPFGHRLSAPRAAAVAAILGDGRLVVAGGEGTGGPRPSADVFTIGGGATTVPFGGTSTGRVGGDVALLPNGKLLLFGGNFGEPYALLFDGASFAQKAASLGRTAARGGRVGDKVFVLGGTVDESSAPRAIEVYEGGVFATAPFDLKTARESGFTATPLPGDALLVAGGVIAGGEITAEAEIVHALARLSTGTMNSPRAHHTATALLDGTVLVAGGAASPTAEVYMP